MLAVKPQDSDTEVKIASGDAALLRAAAGDKTGLVRLTPARLQSIAESLERREQEIKENFPKLVEACSYETRLAITAWVFENIVKHAQEGGTFRYLIYTRLGFDCDAYVPLYYAGGMTISNEFDLTQEEESRE